MNRKQLILLMVVLAVLAVLGWVALQKKQQPYEASKRGIGEKLIPEFPLNDIAKVSIVSSTQQLTIAKSGETWTVQERGGYPADFSKLSEALRKLWEMKVAKPVRVPESRFQALELKAPDQGAGAGTLVRFEGADGKTLTSLLLGAKHMRESTGDPAMGGGGFPDGRYVRVGEEKDNIALVSDPLSNLEPRAADWINKDFFKVEKVRSIALDPGDDSPAWKISRDSEAGTWTLADAQEGETLDSTKVSSANYILSSPYFNDVVPHPDPKELGIDEPRVATLETFDGFLYKVKIGKPLPEDNHALQVAVDATFPTERTPGPEEKEEDKERLDKEFKEKYDKLKEKLAKEQKFADWTYKISKWSVDFLLKERKDLLADKKEETPADAPPTGEIPGIPELPIPPAPLTPPPPPPTPDQAAPAPAPVDAPPPPEPAGEKPAETPVPPPPPPPQEEPKA